MLNGNSILDMVNQAKPIQWSAFRKWVDIDFIHKLEQNMGYGSCPTLKHLFNDYAVSFYRSNYNEKPCVFFDWSCIEYVFVKER